MSEIDELLQQDSKAIMRSIIQRIATGPEMSKDISQAEARAGMRAVLDNAVDPVQAAVFLIALRMKRETDEENRGILDAIRDSSISVRSLQRLQPLAARGPVRARCHGRLRHPDRIARRRNHEPEVRHHPPPRAARRGRAG